MSDLFVHYFQDDLYHLKYAKGNPSLTGREFHDYHEIVLFMEGKAQFISKNIQTELKPGCLVFIPKEHFHQFVVENPDTYVRCIVGFNDDPHLLGLIGDVMTEIRVIFDPSETMLAVYAFLQKAFSENITEEDKSLLLPAALVQLLTEQKYFDHRSASRRGIISELTTRALDYIDTHYTDNLTVSTIASALHVSISSLSHRFRNDLNLSVYRYITEKRLSEVRKLIEKGTSLGEAAILCGFSDYSCFFRLYKKYYSTVPSNLLR